MRKHANAYLSPDWKNYNTDRSPMPMPEYGRHIHQMVRSLLAIPDRQKRTRRAHAVIATMGNLFPHLRIIDDFKHKLWDHLHIMSNFELDIDAPYPKPTPASFEVKPAAVPYFKPDDVESRHYGRYIPNMVWYAAKMPPSHVRAALIKNIANYMKYLYLMWNKDVVSDEIIFKDIERLSGGRINMKGAPRLSVGNYSTPPNERQRQAKAAQNNNRQNQQKRRQQQ